MTRTQPATDSAVAGCSGIFIGAHEQGALGKIAERRQDLLPVQHDLMAPEQHSGNRKGDQTPEPRQAQAVPDHAFGKYAAQAPQRR